MAASAALSQTRVGSRVLLPDWRPVGNAALELSLASVASGPVERVWYSGDGSTLFALTQSGRTLQTTDFERWNPAGPEVSPPVRLGLASPPDRPEPGAYVPERSPVTSTLYGLGRAVYRSDDGGKTWENLTRSRDQSLIGAGLTDLAVSPVDGNEVAVASRLGVWRSIDGGQSWSGLNESLPNLPVRRILSLPEDGRGVRVLMDTTGVFEWAPGERFAWKPSGAPELAGEAILRASVSAAVGERVGTVAAAGEWLYAGSAEGSRLWTSTDAGRNWRSFDVSGGGLVERIFVATDSPRIALAALGSRPDDATRGVHVLRTTNGGIFWDDLTANLPAEAAHGVTADLTTGAVYVATDRGVFFTIADLSGAAPAREWAPISDEFSDSRVYDVRLDEAGNQLYAAVEGEGVFAATAPHRFLTPAVVNAADLRSHAASPGALLSVLGGHVAAARAGALDVPVLARSERESQIQVPFEVSGDALSLALTTSNGGVTSRLTLGLPLRSAAPAIFVDRDGTPMVLDADTGVILDAMNPAHPGSRLQILATGLGRTNPAWPTGLPAPLQDAPEVVASVRVFLDRQEIEPTRATLAPGYVGFYLVEFHVPDIINAGPAELYLEADGLPSNKSRVYLEP